MKDKLKDYWGKTQNLRKSMPNFLKNSLIGPVDEKESEQLSITERINKACLKYKEVRIVYKKTKIPPAYLIYILLISLLFITIGYCDRYLTILIATLYPLYISLKTLQSIIGEEKADGGSYTEEDQKQDIIQWLSYWVVYSLFINFEGLFGKLLKYIPFYFIIKVIFLLLCFLPQYRLSWWIYTHVISKLFQRYEATIIAFGNRIINAITSENEDVHRNKKKV